MSAVLRILMAGLAVGWTAGRSAEPIQVVPSPRSGHVHPSICKTRDGTLVVVYKGANVLMVCRSSDSGETWSEPRKIETSKFRPAEIRPVKKFEVYPGTADLLADGRILVTWNYIADDKAVDGYYERALLFTLSSDGAETWTDQKIVGPLAGKHLGAVRHNVLPWNDGRWLLPLRVGPPRLFDPETENLAVFPLLDPQGKQHEFQQVIRNSDRSLLALGPVLLKSTDEGLSWKEVQNFPASATQRDNLEGRFLTALDKRRVVVTWGIGRDNKGLRYAVSEDGGETWSNPVILMKNLPVAARYYSARTIPLDDQHVGTVFMNSRGVYFVKVSLDEVGLGKAP